MLRCITGTKFTMFTSSLISTRADLSVWRHVVRSKLTGTIPPANRVIRRKISTIIKEDLHKCTRDNTKKLSFFNIRTKCKVLSINSYDNINIALQCDLSIYQFKLQLIDIEKIETKQITLTSYYKDKQYLTNLIDNKILFIICGNWNKYGHLTGDIFLNKDDMDNNNNSINNKLN
jgi:hypothetical protein